MRFIDTITDKAGNVWDYYWFHRETNKKGTLAFRQTSDGSWVIGLLKAGHLGRSEVEAELNKLSGR